MADPARIHLHLDGFPPGPGEVTPAGADPGPGEAVALQAGQEVTGTVVVEVMEDLDHGGLWVGFSWHTKGKGNPESGTGRNLPLTVEGRWLAGTTHRIPFSLKVPWGPISYDGKILQVGWELEAWVDRSLLRKKVRGSLPVRVLAAPDMPEVILGPRVQKREEMERAKRGMGGLWVTLGIVALLVAVGFGMAQSWEMQGWERWSLFLLIVAGFLLMLKGIWGRLGRGKLGEPTVQLSTTELRRGEEIRFSVAIRPDQRTELRTLEAVLECEERVVQGHGQYRSHHRKVVLEKRLMLAKDQTVEAYRGLRKKGSVTLPPDAPTSFAAPDNQVVWWLRFEADLPGWPDWNEPFLLTVKP